MARILRHYVSKIFQPQNVIPKNAVIKYDDITSKSQKLMLDLGIIQQANNGLFYILPLGERALRKLINIVDEEMEKIGGQKMALPSLTAASLWKASGRFDDTTVTDELFTLKDRHDKTFVLSPTHEEAVSELLASLPKFSYRQLPLRLYQITNKFRDEIRPRFGLLRSKEFLMKDLYTFDTNLDSAKKTYEVVTAAYNSIFNRLGVKYFRVAGLTGVIGGSVSHEFHFPSEVGEDRLIVCKACGHGCNAQVFSHTVQNTGEDSVKCMNCGHSSLSHLQGIEVGHTFLLGTKYTMPFKVQFMNQDGKPTLVEMGCYGLGMTRILAAVVECLSQESEIRWPLSMTPFKVCIIPPKAGSKENAAGTELTERICHHLEKIPSLVNDVIVDDRFDLTIGRRLRDAARVGYPVTVVLGKQTMEPVPLVEVNHFSHRGSQQLLLPLSEAVQYIVQQSDVDHEPEALGVSKSVEWNVTHG